MGYELHIDYADKKYLDFHFPERQNTPFFQLSYTDGSSSGCGGDPYESPSASYQVISRPETRAQLRKDVRRHLNLSHSRMRVWTLTCSPEAEIQLKDDKKDLEKIIATRNKRLEDFLEGEVND